MRTRQRVPPEKAALQIRLFQLGTGVKRERPREDGDVKILSLLDHPSANERHKMLAANKASNAANIGIVADQVCAIAGTPDGALDESGHGLAMAPENLASPLDEQQSVVDGMNATPGIHFVAANHHVRIGLGCSVAEAFGVFTRNQQSLIVEFCFIESTVGASTGPEGCFNRSQAPHLTSGTGPDQSGN